MDRALKSVPLLSALFLLVHIPAMGQDVPRVELGPIVGVSYIFDDIDPFKGHAGARVTVNINRNFAVEGEALWQSGGSGNVFSKPGEEFVAQFDLKATRRMIWDGIDVFAVVGPGLVNRRVGIADPNPPPFTIRPTIIVRETVATFNFGGGVEFVPSDRFGIRLDLVGLVVPLEPRPFSVASSGVDTRTMLKLSSMFRF